MRLKGKVCITLLILLMLFPNQSVLAQNTSQQTSIDKFRPIKFWRTDLQNNNITDSKVIPMISPQDPTNLRNIGKAWISWTLETSRGNIGLFAIYDRGDVFNFTIVPGVYTEISWFGLGTQIFMVGSSPEKTYISIYQLGGGEPTQIESDYNTTNHEFLFSNTELLGYGDINDTYGVYLQRSGFNIQNIVTREKMIDSSPEAAIIRQTSGDYILRNFGVNNTIPAEYTGDPQLGFIQLAPAVFDFDTNTVWSPSLGTLNITLNPVKLFQFGFSSSILLDNNNSLWEYKKNGWQKIYTYDFEPLAFSIIDINLYLGTTVHNGLSLLSAGADEDGDLLPDTMEDYYGSLPNIKDSDNDGVNDQVEVSFGTDPGLDDMELDYDQDGLSNQEEFDLGLHPTAADTDFGGAIDGWEVEYGFDPLNREDDGEDPDNDGVSNARESVFDSNPRKKDTDDDGMPDGFEIKFLLDPTDPSDADEDPDRDGRTNYVEYLRGSDPFYANARPLFEGLWMYIFPIGIFSFILSIIIIRQKLIFEEE